MREKIYKIPPVMSWDIEGTEQWLSEMARDGWLLAEDGIKLGIAVFEKAEPCEMRYCLVGAKNGTMAIYDNDGEPEYEEIKHSRKHGWEYIAKRDGFHIYCSADPDARELNTDPEVTAFSLKTVANRQGILAVLALCWLAFHPLLKAGFNLVKLSLEVSSLIILPWLVSVIWLISGVIMRCAYLGKLRRRLRKTGSFKDGRKRKKKSGTSVLRYAVNILMIAVFLFGSGMIYCRNLFEKETKHISLFTDEIPFATFSDIAPEGRNMTEINSGNNRFRQYSDLVAPVCIEWDEVGTVYRDDGGAYRAWMQTEYYETRGEFIAKLLAREISSDYRINSRYEIFEADIPKADFARVYHIGEWDYIIIICDGSRVVCTKISELGLSNGEPEYYIEVSGEEYVKAVVQKFLK